MEKEGTSGEHAGKNRELSEREIQAAGTHAEDVKRTRQRGGAALVPSTSRDVRQILETRTVTLAYFMVQLVNVVSGNDAAALH